MIIEEELSNYFFYINLLIQLLFTNYLIKWVIESFFIICMFQKKFM